MLYPARCKKITVDQSNVLKNRLFRFWGGHPVYIQRTVYNLYLYRIKIIVQSSKISIAGQLLLLFCPHARNYVLFYSSIGVGVQSSYKLRRTKYFDKQKIKGKKVLPESLPRFYLNLPEYRPIFARILYIGFFFGGGGHSTPCPPSHTPMLLMHVSLIVYHRALYSRKFVDSCLMLMPWLHPQVKLSHKSMHARRFLRKERDVDPVIP